MKRKMSSSNKRKWVLTGALLFGGVALLTTGFATWVIGSQIAEITDPGTTVGVDTYKNQNINVTAAFDDDNKLFLAETEAVADGLVQTDFTENGGTPSGDLTITFSKLTVEMGTSWVTAGNEFKGLTIALPTKADDIPSTSDVEFDNTLNANNVITEDSADIINKREPEINASAPLQYIKLLGFRSGAEGSYSYSSVLAPVTSPSEVNGTLTYEWTNVVVEFTWASYYGNSDTQGEAATYSPAKWYNHLSTENSDVSLTYQQNIAKEYDLLTSKMDNSYETGGSEKPNANKKLYVTLEATQGQAANTDTGGQGQGEGA